MPIPTFSINAPINAAEARHDKIDLRIPLGCIRLQNYTGRSAEDFPPFQEAVWDRLVGPSPNAPDALSLIENRVQSRVFGRGSNRTKISVNSRARPGIGPGALFNGNLHMRWRQAPHFEVELSFQGYLNLTRYVRHQGLRDRSTLLQNPQELEESLFRFSPNADGRSDDEFSLDGRDNWLPGAARWNVFLRRWNQLKEEYLTAVQHTLQSEITRVCDFINATGNPVAWHPPGWSLYTDSSLQRVETYWEFSHPAPTELVKSLEPELRAYNASDVLRQEFPGREKREGRLQITKTKNCLSLDATLTPGISLVIYAKTNKRVRFEVRHYLSGLTHRRGIQQYCATMADVGNRIIEATTDAAGVLNRFFKFLRSRVTFVPYSHSPLNLLFLCAQCADLPAYGDAVANLLISNSQVTRLPALAKTIKALERANVLERVNNEQGTASEAFLVTPQYRHALEVLQAVNTTQQVTGPLQRRQRIRSPITRPS